MYTRRIRFDRVFDVRPLTARNGVTTQFGFEADGKTVRDARIKGAHEIPQGVELTVALPREGGWSWLLGWVDHSTGRMVCDKPSSWILVTAVFAILTAGQCFLTWLTLRHPQPNQGSTVWVLGAMCVFLVAVFAAIIRQARLVLQAHRFLSDTQASVGRAASPAA